MLGYASAPDRIARTRVAWNQTMFDLAMARRKLLEYVHERGTQLIMSSHGERFSYVGLLQTESQDEPYPLPRIQMRLHLFSVQSDMMYENMAS